MAMDSHVWHGAWVYMGSILRRGTANVGDNSGTTYE
jgi:hypothetical protein